MTSARTGGGMPEDAVARSAPPPGRRPELDAIRTLVVVGLVFFHAALVFDSRDDFYVKNAETTDVTMVVAGLCVVWAMPILFLIAGFGSRYSLRRRGARGFAAERLLRLGVPLVFATVALLPLPQWLRQRAAGEGDGESYPRFLARFFEVRVEPGEFPFVLQGEHFETGHLWFVVLLLTFSLLPLPLLRGSSPQLRSRWRERAARAVRHRWVLLLPAVPLALISAVLGLEESYAGWSRWAYLLFFLCGFVLATDDRFRAAMRRDAVFAGALGVVLFAACLPGFLLTDDPFTEMSAPAIAARAGYGATGWCWLVAILGALDRPRPAAERADGPEGAPRRGRRVQAYFTTAALPFYILHQPVVVAVAYGVVGWGAPIVVAYLVIVTVSFAVTTLVYDLLVRRTRVTRFLFGMRT